MLFQVTETISKEITFKALLLSIDQVTRYGNMYREGVIQFKVWTNVNYLLPILKLAVFYRCIFY